MGELWGDEWGEVWGSYGVRNGAHVHLPFVQNPDANQVPQQRVA